MPQFLTDACIAWQFEVIFDVFEVEPDKGATLENIFMGDISSSHFLQSLGNQIRKDAFKGDKLSILIVDFRSLPEKPRQDKQDFTVENSTLLHQTDHNH